MALIDEDDAPARLLPSSSPLPRLRLRLEAKLEPPSSRAAGAKAKLQTAATGLPACPTAERLPSDADAAAFALNLGRCSRSNNSPSSGLVRLRLEIHAAPQAEIRSGAAK